MGERAMKGGDTQDSGKSGSVKESTQQSGSRDNARDMKSDSSRTEGTNRDFDENQESINQGHGHPREERGTHTRG